MDKKEGHAETENIEKPSNKEIMYRKLLILIIVFFVFISGCIVSEQVSPSNKNPSEDENQAREPQATPIPVYTPALPYNGNTTEPAIKAKHDRLLIDNISENMTTFYNKRWDHLYQLDELDCSRMSTYLWGYIRSNYHVAPKIVISYQRQHAWLALKVSDVGNSSDYRHWSIKGIDYYYLEATIPKLVTDDNQRFMINGQPYTSAEFYNATIYVFDSPQDANDFHADYSILGEFNQEFVLKKNDLDKIENFLK